ncbi:Alpha/Beta hydrolase protein [Leptodontidium sp. MPI-SDFR-AT-0119]|nr:Alpha/Beta hydrolase protein [Leptodontidium sp. MPI-SDFR-AT-0119]
MLQLYNTIPSKAFKQPTPFTVSIPETQLTEFRTLPKLSRIPAPTFESLQEDGKFGITHKWLTDAKRHWVENFDWRACEDCMNTFPHFTLPVSNGPATFKIHFVALFSTRTDAIPILLLHGWPGSFLEFLPILSLIQSRYTPETLPYHFIVPSLPGYAFSSPPPLDQDFRIEDIARVMNALMQDLGFGDGYVVQGGDIGSKVARVIAAEHTSCIAAHLNFGIMPEPANIDTTSYTTLEKGGLLRAQEFSRVGSAYALEHATFPSTISFTVSASPLSLLPWMAEKFLTWSDDSTTPSLEEILESVSLYYLTDTFQTAIYPYRQLFTPGNVGAHEDPKWKIEKPFGFSWFPKEIAPVPRAWVETTGDLVWWREHSKGGHFAALERPEALLGDLLEFVEMVWRK